MWGSLSSVSRQFLSRFQLGVLSSVPFWYCSSLLSIGINLTKRNLRGKEFIRLTGYCLSLRETEAGTQARHCLLTLSFLVQPWDGSGLEQLNKCPLQTCLQANLMETIPQLSSLFPGTSWFVLRWQKLTSTDSIYIEIVSDPPWRTESARLTPP